MVEFQNLVFLAILERCQNVENHIDGQNAEISKNNAEMSRNNAFDISPWSFSLEARSFVFWITYDFPPRGTYQQSCKSSPIFGQFSRLL